jgi:hypothetical protein
MHFADSKIPFAAICTETSASHVEGCGGITPKLLSVVHFPTHHAPVAWFRRIPP